MSRAWLWLGLLVAFTGSAKELVLVDADLAPKIQAKPGVELRRLHGLDDLPGALTGDRWSRVSLISHGQPGALQLGGERLDQAFLTAHPDFLTAWRHQLTADAQLELWGCEVAKGQGHQLVDSLATAIDHPVLASTDATGPAGLGGDLTLEYGQGRTPDSTPVAQLQQLLALSSSDSQNFESIIDGTLYDSPATIGSFTFYSNSTGMPAGQKMQVASYFTHVDNNGLYVASSIVGDVTQVRIVGASTFKLRSIWLGAGAGSANVVLHAYLNNAEIGTGRSVSLSDSSINTSGFSEFENIDELRITSTDLDLLVDNIVVDAPVIPITVTDARISISGASGTGGVFKIGDTVTATWNNTASGDNNSGITGVTMDFSQFGGGAAVAASNSSGTWTATYTITSGSIDATNRNVSVSATNVNGTRTMADSTNATVDNQAPTVTDAKISLSGGSGTGGAFKIGDTVTATWNNTASGDNNSDTISSVTVNFSQFGGGAAVTASNSSGTWTATYTLVAGAVDASNRNVSVTVTDNAGNTTTTADTTNASVDNVAPTVTDANISISGGSGTGGAFKIGDTVTATWNNTASGDNNSDTISNVTVDFSQFGGGAAVTTSNSSGTWSATYTLVAGAVDATNRNVSVTATDNAGNTTTTADTTNASVDNVAPAVTDAKISLSGASGTGGVFKIGDTVTATWNNTASGDNNSDTISSVTVDFSPFGGGAAVVAGNSSGTWSATYTLVAGAINASNRDVSVTATDNAGNMTTTSDTSNATVDTTVASVTGVAVPSNGSYHAGAALNFTIHFDEAVTVNTSGGTPYLALTVGSSAVHANYVSGSGSTTLIFSYPIQAGDNDSDGVAVGVLSANGGTLKDGAGNNATLTLNSVGSTSGVLVDTTAPAVTSVAVPVNSTYVTGEPLNFTIHFDEPVFVTGLPQIALTVGSSTVYASYVSGSGSSAVTFRHTVQSGENDADGITVGTLGLNGGALKDAAANNATLTLNSVGSTSSVLVDAAAPTVTSVAVPAAATYIAGQTLNFTVNFSEAVMANTSGGTPRLALTLGSSTVYASYVSGSGSTALNFSYTVQAGDNDSDGISVGNLSANGGTLKDAAGNDATLTLNSIASTSAVLVDTSAPVVSSVSVPTNGTYITGQSLAFSVNFSKAVTVDSNGGTPYLALTVGSSAVHANYVSGSGTTTLIFSYPIQAGDNDSDGVAVGVLSANGGTLKDGAGNNATLTLNSVANTGAVLVDGVAPTLISSSPADNSASMPFDANLQLVLSEPLSAGSGTLAIYDAADDSLVEANAVGSPRVTLSGNTVTLDLLATLLPTHSYYLQVGAQALLDAAGNAYAGISDKTTLNFTVANAAPVALADSVSTQEDTAVQVDVTANDSDADSALNKASVAVVTAAQHGTTSVDTGTGVISYTPASNYNGSDSFSYRVQDIYGVNSNVVSVSVTVQPVNDAPQAVADIASTTEDTALMVDVLANDSDIDNGDSLNPATLSLVTPAAHGTAQISNGQVIYTPAANFNGSDTFSYTVTDQHGAVSNVATVIINVGSSNDAPVATNDTATTDEDNAVTVEVLANDSDLDGTLVPSSVALLQQPAHGQVLLNSATGALVYTPTANYFGQDTFSYAVQDNEGATSNAASVTVTVNSVNDAPVAVNNSATLQEDASLSINVLGNDSDVDGTLVPSSVQLVGLPTHGTAFVNAVDGSVRYTPDSDAVGDDSFSYRVQDDQGAWSNVATVMLTIQPVNDAPLANADQGVLDEDSALTLHLLANDSDIDGSLQDVRIVAQPASGVLEVGSGGVVTYTPAANFNGHDSFSYQAVDNEGALSPAAVVSLTVRAVNDAPTISGQSMTTLLEGAHYQFAPVINDVDGDTLTVTATGLPAWLTLNRQTGELSGTPAIGQAGQYDNIVLTVSDGVLQTALPAFSLTVLADLDGDGQANINDDDDDNDGMSDSYESAHGFNPLDPADASTDADQDGVSNQQESVDGTNPHDASDYVDTVAPVLSPVADVTVDATGLFTPVSVRKLLGLTDSATDDAVTATLRALSRDNVDGLACCNVTIDGLSHGQLLLSPGRHSVVYRAADRKGNVGTVTQLVRVRPLVSMSKDQVAVPGQSLSFSIILNGPAPDYPFTVPYVIDDSSTLPATQHSLQAGSVTFTAGQNAIAVPVTLGAGAAASGDQTLVVRLDDQTSDDQDLAAGYDPLAPDSHDINAGAKRTHAITVTTGNVAPQVELSLRQQGQQTMLVTPDGGAVTVAARVEDPNLTDTHTFDWSGTAAVLVDTDGDLTNATLIFDPAGLVPGSYPLQVKVTDSQGASTVHTLYFRVVAALPVLSATADSDNDGVSDQDEGIVDSDGDGIVDYLDNQTASNVLPESLKSQDAFLMECEPGVLCRLGQYALQSQDGGSRLQRGELASLAGLVADSTFAPVGGIFDFEITELPTPGQSVSVVIPLDSPIPVNAVYRKYLNGRWTSFVVDANNQLHSAPGSAGYCPPPGDTQWTSGLTAGDHCVQLTLEDGGPNDADGLVNASIVDPGAVSVSTADDRQDDDGSGAMGGVSLLALWALRRYRRREWGR